MHNILPAGSTIKIQRGLSYKVCNDVCMVKVMSVYYQLKSFYVGGVILDYVGRRFEVSSCLGISEGTLRIRVGRLRAMGLVVMNGRNLELRGGWMVRELFDIDEKFRQTTKFNFCKEAYKAIMAIGIDENISRQIYILKKKLIDDKIDRIGIKETRIARKLKRFRRKNFELICERQLKRNSKTILNDKLPKINAQTTLSRQGLAKFFGKKSKGTGSRWAHKLSKGLFIEDVPQYLEIGKGVSWVSYLNMRLGYRCSYKKGVISLRVANQLNLKLF